MFRDRSDVPERLADPNRHPLAKECFPRLRACGSAVRTREPDRRAIRRRRSTRRFASSSCPWSPSLSWCLGCQSPDEPALAVSLFYPLVMRVKLYYQCCRVESSFRIAEHNPAEGAVEIHLDRHGLAVEMRSTAL